MQGTDIAAQVIATLGPVVSGGASVAQGVATKVLGDLVAQRLSRNEQGRQAWNGFRVNPQNDSLVRYLLSQELERDISFRLEIERALRDARKGAPAAVVQQAMSGTGPGSIQVGGSTGHIATGGGTVSTSSVRNTTNKKKSSGGAVVGVVAIVVVVVVALVVFAGVKVVGGLLKSSKDGGLSASSTCQQFLNTDEDNERQALADIGISEGFSGYSNPLALPEIQYECGGVPNMTLGALIQRDGNMA